MKILHVTKKYVGALGGDAVVVSNLGEQQRAAGHQVVVVTSHCDEITPGRHVYKCGLKDTSSGLDTITLRRMFSLLMMAIEMFSILRRERPDVIHTHSVDMAFFVSFAALWYGIPMVHTFHIVTFYDQSQPRIRRWSELVLAKCARIRKVTAPNESDVRRLRSAGLRQTELLPNGVDIALWEPHGYTEKNTVPTFVAVGRLEDQKGYEYLIRAAALLLPDHPLNVIIVGEGSQKKALQKLAQSLNVADSVQLVGRKTGEEIRRLLAEAHVAVFPALYETTPLTLLEAWAAEVPTIATKVGILQDVPDTFAASVVVPVRDERALAAAMRRSMHDDTLRRATVAAGHQEVRQYTWPRIARLAEKIYGEG